MKKLLSIIVTLFIFLILPLNVLAFEDSATSTILMETDNNRILYAHNINEKRSIASISKIMTAILAIESGRLDEEVLIGSEINNAYGSAIYLKENEKIKLKDLVYGLMLRSGNDASLAIAKYVSGSVNDFILMMNDKAQELGMHNTIFNNPNGLDEEEGNYSTAYDMALLTSYAMKNKIYKEIVSTKNYKVNTNLNNYYWTNKNKLLFNYENCTGGKTGYTKIAKRTLVTTASKDNLNLVVVTLNDGDDFNDHKNIYEVAFHNYHNYEILTKGYLNIPDNEQYQQRKYYITESIYYPLLEEETELLSIKYELLKNINNNGKYAGDIIVYLDGNEIIRKPMYLEINNNNSDWISKIFEWIKNI